MDKATAQQATLKAHQEITSLVPSALIALFEIDLTDIAFDTGIVNIVDLVNPANTIFKFHNNVALTKKSIFWRGIEYKPAPIQVEGYEISTRGTPPVPRLRITVDDRGVPYLTQFKTLSKKIGDLTGAKVTRIRTFAKFLDSVNFLNNIAPDEFTPDVNVEFPRDIYYIDRKVQEDKFTIEYELSAWDLDNVKLPGRLVLATKCNAVYRGQGCLYEYSVRRNEIIHGKASESSLPLLAPCITNDKDELLTEILGVELIDRGEWNRGTSYNIGNCVYIVKQNLKYYFAARVNGPKSAPPNTKEWVSEACSKTITGCRLRWGKINNGMLMFNGFPSVNKVI